MKRICLTLAALALIAGIASAQAAAPAAPAVPVQNTEIYGAAFFDYYQTQNKTDKGYLGNWYFNKARIGLKTNVADNVKFSTELELATFDLRLAYLDWMPTKDITVTGGKVFKNYAPLSQFYGSRFMAAGVKYNYGAGLVGFQLGNPADESNATYKTSTYGNVSATTSTAGSQTVGNSGLVVWAPQKDVMFDPMVSFNAIATDDMKLTLSANGEFDYFQTKTLAKTKLATAKSNLFKSVDGSAVLTTQGFTVSTELTDQYLGEDKNDVTLWAKVAYAAGAFNPCAYVLVDNLAANKKYATQDGKTTGRTDATLTVELPYTVAKNFQVNPMFSKALVGHSYYDGIDKDWTIGLRMQYAFSSKF